MVGVERGSWGKVGRRWGVWADMLPVSCVRGYKRRWSWLRLKLL